MSPVTAAPLAMTRLEVWGVRLDGWLDRNLCCPGAASSHPQTKAAAASRCPTRLSRVWLASCLPSILSFAALCNAHLIMSLLVSATVRRDRASECDMAAAGRLMWADSWERQPQRSEAPTRATGDEIRTRASELVEGRPGRVADGPSHGPRSVGIIKHRPVHAASRMSQLQKSSSAANRNL